MPSDPNPAPPLSDRGDLRWRVDVAVLLFLVALRTVLLALNDADPDLWGRILYARDAWNRGTLAWFTDVFSYTAPGARWVDHEWGFSWIAFAVHALGGFPALRIVRIALFLSTLAIVLRPLLARPRTPLAMPLLAAAVVIPLTFGFGGPRAQGFSYLFFAWMLYCLAQSWERGARWLVFAALPLPLWVNIHGGFLAGLGVLGIWGAARFLVAVRARDWRVAGLLVGVGLVGALSTLTTPWGLEYPRFIWTTATMHRPEVPEWDALRLTSLAGLAALPLLLICAGRLFLTPRRVPDLLALAVLVAAALRSQRHLPFLAIGAAILAAPVIAQWLTERRRLTPLKAGQQPALRLFATVLLGVAASGLVASLPLAFRAAPSEPVFPAAATRFLEHERGGVVADFDWSQYVLFHAWPGIRVAFDGRYEEVYGEAQTRRYMDWHYGREGWRELIDAPATTHALVETGSERDARLTELEGWERVHTDPLATVFRRIGAQTTASAP